MNKKVLITGATSCVGLSLMKAFDGMPEAKEKLTLFAGVKGNSEELEKLSGYNVKPVHFDFEDMSTYKPALTNITTLFLVRPSHIENPLPLFEELIDTAVDCQVFHIVFLSERNICERRVVTSYEIEKLIKYSKIRFTIIRPAYFMQNFITTFLHKDLVEKKRIFIPAGNTKFTFVDVRDIANVAAEIICNSRRHINKKYEINNFEKLSLQEVASKLSEGMGMRIKYTSPSFYTFYKVKHREGVPVSKLLSIMSEYFLSRFKEKTNFRGVIEALTGRVSITFTQFVRDNKEELLHG